MTRKSVVAWSLTAMAVAASVALGPAMATWTNGQHAEPSSSYDTSSYMFQGPNQAPTERVYFDIEMTSRPLGEAAYPANQPVRGEVARQSYVPVAVSAFAYLGFWRDCNKDGYIGDGAKNASSGQTVYPRALVDEISVTGSHSNSNNPIKVYDAICPLGSPYNPKLADGTPSSWINEFRWIGPTSKDGGQFYPVNDPEARVWSDFGLPGGSPEPWSPNVGAPTPKSAPDFTFTFQLGTREQNATSRTDKYLNRDTASDVDSSALTLGNSLGSMTGGISECSECGTGWFSDQTYIVSAQQAQDWLSKPLNMTSYAHLSYNTFANDTLASQSNALPARMLDAHTYGDYACFAGWDCDPSHWAGPVKLGNYYDLRDVDTIGATLSQLAGVPLPPVPTLPDGQGPPCDNDANEQNCDVGYVWVPSVMADGPISANGPASCSSSYYGECGSVGVGPTSIWGDATCRAAYGQSCGFLGTGPTTITGDASCSGSCGYAGTGATTVTGDASCSGSCGDAGTGATTGTGDADCHGGDCGVAGVGAASVTGDAKCRTWRCGQQGIGAVSVLGDASCEGCDTSSGGIGAVSVAGHASCDRPLHALPAERLFLGVYDLGRWLDGAVASRQCVGGQGVEEEGYAWALATSCYGLEPDPCQIAPIP